MKWNFKWGKNNKREMTPELTERGVNVYQHENKIQGAEHLGQKKCAECGNWFTPTHYKEVCCSPACKHIRHRKFQNEWQHKNYEQERQKKVEAVKKANEGKETTMVQTREIETITRPDGTTWTPPVKTCPTCGKQFVCATNRQVFCSEECRDKAYAMKAAGVEMPRRTPKGYVSVAPTEPRKCDICGKEFMPRTKKQRYCSKECGQEAMRRCTRKWHELHEGRRKEYVAHREAIKRGEIVADKYSETATVVRKLIETGVDDSVVAKYLQTVFGK